jgi:hypothetical protein
MESDNERFLSDMRDAIDEVSDEPYTEYWYYFGKFIHVFSRVEERLLGFLRAQIEASPSTCAILLSGMRLDAAKDTINRILETTNQAERKARLERPFAQLAAINTIRNNIVHWGAIAHSDTEFFVSNWRLNHPKGKEKHFYVSKKGFEQMISDLNKIKLFLLLEESPSSSVDPRLVSYLQEPWRYTPPQPSPPKT